MKPKAKAGSRSKQVNAAPADPPVNPKYILTVTDIAFVAECLRDMQADKGGTGVIEIGKLAAWADKRQIIGGAASMNLPTFVEAIANVLPHVLRANAAQLKTLPAALDRAASIIREVRAL